MFYEFGPSTVCWLYKSLYAGDLGAVQPFSLRRRQLSPASVS